jgi:Flp pilus assembly protein CpaB
MFSRIAAFAAALAIVAAGSLAFTASAQQTAPGAAAKQVRVIQLERVIITAKRLNADTR